MQDEVQPSAAAPSYQPELDGIRAIAIVAVLLFHTGAKWLSGGYLGVDVFFVVSGYLITTLLLREQMTAGTISLRAFYRRRARRLLPALVVTLFVAVNCAALFMKDVLESTVRDLPWALTGLSNWWFIFHQQSYFEAMGRPALLQHTWSLGVEAQFYFFWPIVMLMLGLTGLRRAAIACFVLSTAALFMLSSGNPSRAYFGTDAHSLGLFAGAALAAIGTQWRWKPRLADILGGLSLAGLFALFHFAGDSANWLQIALPTAAVLSVLVITAAAVSGSILGKLLSLNAVRWIGQRSYSMYLWHWPVFQATRPQIDTSLEGAANLLVRLALTTLLADLSYRYIETPARHGAFAINWKGQWVRYATVAGALLIALAQVTFVWNAYAGYTDETALQLVRDLGERAKPAMLPVARPRVAKSQQARPSLLVPDHLKDEAPATLLGDSVLLAASNAIAQHVNVVNLDAEVGRQANHIRERALAMAKEGKLSPTVILDLGNNGTVEEPTLRSILESLKACERVVVINARVPRPWQDDNNALLARVVPTYPNAVVADWFSESAGHSEYFAADGVHPHAAGAKAYASAVLSALLSIPAQTQSEEVSQ